VRSRCATSTEAAASRLPCPSRHRQAAPYEGAAHRRCRFRRPEQLMINSQRPGTRSVSSIASSTGGMTSPIMIGSQRRHPAATPLFIWLPRSGLGPTSATSTNTRCTTITERRWRSGLRLKPASRDSCTPPRWSSMARAATAVQHTAFLARHRAVGMILTVALRPGMPDLR